MFRLAILVLAFVLVGCAERREQLGETCSPGDLQGCVDGLVCYCRADPNVLGACSCRYPCAGGCPTGCSCNGDAGICVDSICGALPGASN